MSERDVPFDEEVAERCGDSWAHLAPLSQLEAGRKRIGADFDRRVAVSNLHALLNHPLPTRRVRERLLAGALRVLERGGALAENCEVAPGCKDKATWIQEIDDGNVRRT